MENNIKNRDNKIALFEGEEVRKINHNDEWWFVISDVIKVLTQSKDPSGYIKDMRRRNESLSEGWGQIAIPPGNFYCWWKTKDKLCKYGVNFKNNTINSISKSGIFQNMAIKKAMISCEEAGNK